MAFKFEIEQYLINQGITNEEKFCHNFPQTEQDGNEVYYLNEAQILELTGQISSAGYYTFNEWLEFVADSSTGSGFRAKAYSSNLRDGSLKIELTNPGEGYLTKPLVILQGGSLLPGVFGAKESLQITAGNKIHCLRMHQILMVKWKAFGFTEMARTSNSNQKGFSKHNSYLTGFWLHTSS